MIFNLSRQPLFVMILWVFSFLLLASDAQAISPVQPCNSIDHLGYIEQRDTNKTSVVVFVHGVLSSAGTAWGTGSGNSWPCLLRSEPVFNTSNIYVHNYRTGSATENPTIDDLADIFLKDLDTDDVLRGHAHITIVAHSMGGLVVSRALLKMAHSSTHSSLLNRIRLINFYGVPAKPSELAAAMSYLSVNKQFSNMSDNKFLERHLIEWRSIDWKFKYNCLAEGNDTGYMWPFKVRVVPFESAVALCLKSKSSETRTLNGYDHISMVKPQSIVEDPHRVLLNRFKSCVWKYIERPDGRPVKGFLRSGATVLVDSLLKGLSDRDRGDGAAQDYHLSGILFDSGSISNRYFSPRSFGSSLLYQDYEYLQSNLFVPELFKYIRGSVHPSILWVDSLKDLGARAQDGQLQELVMKFVLDGSLQDSDLVLAISGRNDSEQILIFSSVDDAGGVAKIKIKGFVILPLYPDMCG